MREIETHKVAGEACQVEVQGDDDPGPGGARTTYEISSGATLFASLQFQDGAAAECGVNGITNESLLAVVIDRLDGYQDGPYPCRENARALAHARDALDALKDRTRDRIARGVEGTFRS